ncbi:SIMPL domain-containing protein [Salipaludibacillus neizhouensis]|uniref:SIMPL domain-containing protein n=1 Tax=Salipaludibacillus neizhouensis TaxID=885475 RepID=UPI0016027561|nr:SIMPL domain-containing protein [Salipaludibacillus neizhouensis]
MVYNPYSEKVEQDFSRRMIVTGMSSLSVAPNTASIKLEVITENELLTQAQEENAYVMNRVIQSLLEVGVSRENIQTTAYHIHPMYDYVDGQQVFRAYQVRNGVTVMILNVGQAGTIIDIAVKNGVNSVSDIQFSVANSQQYYQKALSNALQAAVAKAQTMAATLQVTLDPIPIKITENFKEEPQTFSTFAALEISQTPIEPGKIVIEARVEAQFRYLEA